MLFFRVKKKKEKKNILNFLRGKNNKLPENATPSPTTECVRQANKVLAAAAHRPPERESQSSNNAAFNLDSARLTGTRRRCVCLESRQISWSKAESQ